MIPNNTTQKIMRETEEGKNLESHGSLKEFWSSMGIEAFVSSGNIFADLGCPNPEELQAKSDLAIQIYQTIKIKKLTQKEAAEIVGIDPIKVFDIIRGKLSKYSIDRLEGFLRLLDDNHGN